MDDSLSLLKGNLVKDGKPFEFTNEEYIGLYFSALWCPPCRMFTPKLKTFYHRLAEKGRQFEVVFVSSDCDQEAFDEYFQDMPWAALSYDCREIRDLLAERYGVRGFPTLVVLDQQGRLITTSGRLVINKKTGDEEDFSWD